MAQHEAPEIEAPADGTAAAAEERPPGACSVCPHVWAEHDALGVRYCTATMASAKTRGCICGSAPLAA